MANQDDDKIEVQLSVTASGLITTYMRKAEVARLEERLQEDNGDVSLIDDDYGIDHDDLMNGLNIEVEDLNIVKRKKKS